jgi:hypothetical protein
MTTLSLRTLLREPATIKKLTASGHSVQITENGKPLWVVSPMAAITSMSKNAAGTADLWEAHFDELLAQAPTETSKISMSAVLEQSRGSY